MLYDKSADRNKNVIHIEMLSKYLSKGDKEKIENILNSNNIEIEYHDFEIKASPIEALIVFFNEPLTQMILTGIISAAAYDVIKSVLLRLLKNIKKNFIFQFNNVKKKIIKRRCTDLDLHFNFDNFTVDVLLSNKINKKQNLEYIDKIFNKIKELNKMPAHNTHTKEFYIIEYDKKTKSIKTMTMLEYAKEQKNKHKNKKKKR